MVETIFSQNHLARLLVHLGCAGRVCSEERTRLRAMGGVAVVLRAVGLSMCTLEEAEQQHSLRSAVGNVGAIGMNCPKGRPPGRVRSGWCSRR